MPQDRSDRPAQLSKLAADARLQPMFPGVRTTAIADGQEPNLHSVLICVRGLFRVFVATNSLLEDKRPESLRIVRMGLL